jgi:hypothetical protein
VCLFVLTYPFGVYAHPGLLAIFVTCQSWGATDFTWLTLPQQQLASLTNTNPDFGPLYTEATAAAEASGVTQGDDYDGLMIVYHTALEGPFSFGGGWGDVNGLTEYMVSAPHAPFVLHWWCLTGLWC